MKQVIVKYFFVLALGFVSATSEEKDENAVSSEEDFYFPKVPVLEKNMESVMHKPSSAQLSANRDTEDNIIYYKENMDVKKLRRTKRANLGRLFKYAFRLIQKGASKIKSSARKLRPKAPRRPKRPRRGPTRPGRPMPEPEEPNIRPPLPYPGVPRRSPPRRPIPIPPRPMFKQAA
ncbi:hypothetical protein L9F63_022046 [Diploptera punctata]|uniref:Uncharacterized protein n=1 Tax=Diploptera punctata TaxID=6984 RepID=A0AAD8EBE8_DIPPU|nr:hypothetical protein L9F63_022046 [Diploptera punctata]